MTRKYEVFFVIEAEDDEQANRLANEAWYGANGSRTSEAIHVIDCLARERIEGGGLEEVAWPDWQSQSSVDLRVRYGDS